MAAVLFFEEDEVAMYAEATGYRCGIVTESSEYFSSDEDDENEYDTYERLRKGTVRVAWHPDGKSQVLKESELKLADRSLMPGDVVRRFIKGEDSQRGSVTATRIQCHLQVIGKPAIICNIDTKDLLPLSLFTTHPGDVHLDSWVGRLVNINDRITLRFSDGARCEVSDEETIDLLLDFKDAYDKQPKESAFSPMTFFEGQVLKGEFGSLQDAKWLKTTKTFNQASARKFHSREVVVSVEKVETFQLEVNWICRGYSSHQEMTPTAMQPPPRIIKGENLTKVKQLDCFEASNYQIGDRAFYILKDSDKLIILNPKDHHSAIHRVMQFQNSHAMGGIVSVATDHETDKIVSSDSQGPSADVKTQADEEPSESNLEKKDSQGLVSPETTQSDSNTLVPDESADVSAGEASALQTKVASEKKAKTGVKRPTAQVKQLRKKKLKPAKVKPQHVNQDISPPKPGQKLPVEVIYTSTLVDVTWQDGTRELDIPSTDLFPIHHLDELEFFPGDYVASSSEIQMYDVYGVVQSVDHSGRTCKVRWLSHNNASSIDTVIKIEEVSVYDIKDHPDLKFRPGHVVVRVGAEEQRAADETSDASGELRPIGQVFELCCDGQMVIKWDDDTQSCCYPMQLYLVGDEATDVGDTDSEDSYSSEEESSSDGSCEWETEEEEWGPVEEGVSVEGIVEWSLPTCSSKELLLVVSDLKEVTKKIEDLVSAMQTKASTQTSAKFFRQLTLFFRLCHEFDHVAGTAFFENEELVTVMAEIKKLNKKMKALHHNKQVLEGPEPNNKESEMDKCSKPAQRNAPLSRDESGNDSGLEKSPSGSELRDIEPTDASQSTDCAVVPQEGATAVALCSQSVVEIPESAPCDTIKSESCLDDAAVAQAINKLPKESAASKNETENEATASLENSVIDLATKLTKLCEQLTKLGKVWLNSEAEAGKLCISAVQLLSQVISSNTENISAVFRSSGSSACDSTSEQSLPHVNGIEADKSKSMPVQNGLLELASCPSDASLPVKTHATSKGVSVTYTRKGCALGLKFDECQSVTDEEVDTASQTPATPAEIRAKVVFNPGCPSDASLPVKTHATSKGVSVTYRRKDSALGLKFDECQSVTDEEVDTASKTPATPAEIRAKVMFNPEGFTLLDYVPEFHHFREQKHTPVDAKLFTSTIQKEMKLLQSCLPNGIYVKGFESRMDLFSIMIEGPSRTPYEDGLFFFDVQLPNNYPSSPPLFFYISYCTDRLNPNLYEDGKVCVSLLGTWTGKGTEVWHSKSNLLQVLISIQGLILNPEPYYNEAGYERQKGTQLGLENSRMYNEMAILKMVQSMTKIAVNPFQPFSSEIRIHLRDRAYRMINRLRCWISATENVSPRTLTIKTGEFGSEASSSSSPSNESKSEAAVASSPSHASDSKKAESNRSIDPAAGLKECVPLDLIENSDKVNVEVAESYFPNPNNLLASTSGTLEPHSQSSVEALCSLMQDNGEAASLPAFPLLPVSKGFKLSLSKCLDNFESVLTSIGICPNGSQ